MKPVNEYPYNLEEVYELEFISIEERLICISKKNQIPMSFIVGRLAKKQIISYRSKLYNKYKEA